MRIKTTPKALIIGAGVAGLRAALSLSDMGLSVFVIEKEAEVGGWTAKFGNMFPNNNKGSDIINSLHNDAKKRENITIFTNAELIEKGGSVGDFSVVVKVGGKETISGSLTYQGRTIKEIAYIYCVGSRQEESEDIPHPNKYCSRYCCTAAVHSSLEVGVKDRAIHQYHLYRDMRTYGKFELLYNSALNNGSVFMKYGDNDFPKVNRVGDKVSITVKDQLTRGEEFDIYVDLLVLVTGMIPRENKQLIDVLKLPIGMDGFFNEIHPKLRPVETVIDGVFIAGASQGPKTLAESIASSMAAVSKGAALLMKGYVDLEPLIAKIDPERCVWCDECTKACPYDAVEKVSFENKEVARIVPSLCKGGGACVPVCPENAIDVEGYTDIQITTMIDSLIKEVVDEKSN